MKDILSRLPLLRLEFCCTSRGITVPHNPGSAWHGGLGKALHDVAPQSYQVLYGEKEGALPHPYVLRPPQGHESLPRGARFNFEIILAGPAVAEFPGLLMAVDHWSRLGVGPGLGGFTVERILQHLPDGLLLPVFDGSAARAPHAHSAAELWQTERTATQLQLELRTPLLIKQDNGHLRQAPDCRALMQRLINRIDMLIRLDPSAPTMGRPAKDALLGRLQHIEISSNTLQWQTQERYSARQKAWMPFGGLAGEIVYCGDLSAVTPWLTLLEWLHLGNKTTFGHGRIEVRAA